MVPASSLQKNLHKHGPLTRGFKNLTRHRQFLCLSRLPGSAEGALGQAASLSPEPQATGLPQSGCVFGRTERGCCQRFSSESTPKQGAVYGHLTSLTAVPSQKSVQPVYADYLKIIDNLSTFQICRTVFEKTVSWEGMRKQVWSDARLLSASRSLKSLEESPRGASMSHVWGEVGGGPCYWRCHTPALLRILCPQSQEHSFIKIFLSLKLPINLSKLAND